MSKEKEAKIKERAILHQSINEGLLELDNILFLLKYIRSENFDDKKIIFEGKLKKLKNDLSSAIERTKYWNDDKNKNE